MSLVCFRPRRGCACWKVESVIDMASVVRLAVGALSAVAHQAATFCSTPLRLLSVPRLATAHSSRQGIATSSTRHASVMARSSSLLSAVSSTSLSPAPMRTVLQNVQRVCVPVDMQSRRSYHVRVALKKRCSSCYFVRRKGRLYVECKAKPRHKQMQVMSKRKTWKEDYSEGNIKGAMHWKYHRDHGYYRLGNTPFVRHDWLKGKIGVTV